MRPSIALDLKRSAVREAACRYRTANPRVFGSVVKERMLRQWIWIVGGRFAWRHAVRPWWIAG